VAVLHKSSAATLIAYANFIVRTDECACSRFPLYAASPVAGSASYKHMVKSQYMNRPLCWACTIVGLLAVSAILGQVAAVLPAVIA
jgi:hypothetical protein